MVRVKVYVDQMARRRVRQKCELDRLAGHTNCYPPQHGCGKQPRLRGGPALHVLSEGEWQGN